VADDDVGSRGTDLVHETGGEGGHDLGGELAADETPHVVGLDELGEVDRGGIHVPKTT
jgi:hypothetical protein